MDGSQKVILFALFFLFSLLIYDETHAEVYQKFNMANGDEIFSIISRESIEYLKSHKQAPEFVFQPFQIGDQYIWSPIKTLAFLWKPEEAEADELTLREVIENYADVLINRYDLPSKRVKNLIQCESNWNPRAYNAKDTDGKPAYGILQFKKSTFTGTNIWSWEQQLSQGLKMMDEGQWKKWPVCSRG